MKPQAYHWACQAHDEGILYVRWSGIDEVQRLTAGPPHCSAGTSCRMRLDATL